MKRKKLLHVIFLSICLVFSSTILTSCTTSYKGTKNRALSEREKHALRQEELRRAYGPTLENLAHRFTQEASRIISPKSGREWIGRIDLYNYEIVENVYEGYVACRATLQWQARDILKGVSYDWCELGGIITFYYNKGKAFFEYDSRNEQVIRVSSRKDWEKLDAGLALSIQ